METVAEFLFLVRVNQLISPTTEVMKGVANLSLNLEILQRKSLEPAGTSYRSEVCIYNRSPIKY